MWTLTYFVLLLVMFAQYFFSRITAFVCKFVCCTWLVLQYSNLPNAFFIEMLFICNSSFLIIDLWISTHGIQYSNDWYPATVISSQYILPSSKRSVISWSDLADPIAPLLLYIKSPLPINKQFSIDSFLDWEGLHWDFSSVYPLSSVSISASAPTPKHQTR